MAGAQPAIAEADRRREVESDNPDVEHYEFGPLPDDCKVGKEPLVSFVMRELTGKDQLAAKRQVEHYHDVEGVEDPMLLFEFARWEEMRNSLVEVNGEQVNGEFPYIAMDDWNARAIAFAKVAFNDLNGGGEDEVENFRKSRRTVSTKARGRRPQPGASGTR